MKGKRYKKENKNSLGKVIVYMIYLVCIITMIFSGYKIFKWIKENNDSKVMINEIREAIKVNNDIDNVEKYEIDFEKLKQKNPDTVAWLKVNGTDIEYPVVKTANNDFYMTHSFDKSYNSAGWVFMDYRNKLDDTDKNMIIYAHNRLDGSFFSSLKNILTPDWQNNKNNLIIPFITENEKAEYQVFSVYKIEKEDYYITTNFETNEEFQEFIDVIKSRSDRDFGVDVTSDDHILTLSTCANTNKHRIVLHAKKI